MRLNEEQAELVEELREAGWAVVLVSPEELEGTPRDWVETEMKEAAQKEIEG